MLILKHLKNPPTCFDHYSDRLQGARRFLVNLLKPKDIYIYTYICRTAALTSRHYFFNIYSTNIHTEYFKHAA